MRDRLNAMPVWALLLLAWLGFTAGLFLLWTIETAIGVVDGGLRLRWLLLITAGAAIPMAAALVWGLKLRWRIENRAVGEGAPGEIRKAAVRATVKGPVPSDPEVRAAAIRLAQEQILLLAPKRLRKRIALLSEPE